jgi:hypothetical protein
MRVQRRSFRPRISVQFPNGRDCPIQSSLRTRYLCCDGGKRGSADGDGAGHAAALISTTHSVTSGSRVMVTDRV